MNDNLQLEGCIFEINSEYNTHLGGYTALMSDIHKLGEMVNLRFNRERVNIIEGRIA